MPLDFQAQNGSAVDSNSGLTIYAPRMLPASPPENPEHTEYQYSIYRNGQRFDGLGLFGTYSALDGPLRRERIFTLDLGRDWVLDSILGLKKRLGNEDHDFAFIKDLSLGLISVFVKNRGSDDDVRYRVVANADLFEQRGVAVPRGIERSSDGTVVLAEIFVPNGSDEADEP